MSREQNINRTIQGAAATGTLNYCRSQFNGTFKAIVPQIQVEPNTIPLSRAGVSGAKLTPQSDKGIITINPQPFIEEGVATYIPNSVEKDGMDLGGFPAQTENEGEIIIVNFDELSDNVDVPIIVLMGDDPSLEGIDVYVDDEPIPTPDGYARTIGLAEKHNYRVMLKPNFRFTGLYAQNPYTPDSLLSLNMEGEIPLEAYKLMKAGDPLFFTYEHV